MIAVLRAAPLVFLLPLMVLTLHVAPPVIAGVVVVALFVTTVVALEGVEPTSLALGALAGLMASAGGSVWIAFALTLVFVARSLRARSLRSAAGLSGTGAIAAMIAVALVGRFGDAGWLPQMTAIAMAGALLTAPLLWPLDDRVAVALRRSANRVKGQSRRALLRGLALRRRPRPELPRRAHRQLENAWRSLSRLGEAAAERDKLGDQLEAHARALTHAHRAAMDASVYRVGLGEALHGFSIDGELRAEASALREVSQTAM